MQRALLSAPSWVLPGASADLDFVHNRAWAGGSTSLASLLATSRASVGMAQFANGAWASFPANVPRITDQGLLIEQASTNALRNNAMAGAAAGSPGTLPNDWNWGTGSLAPNVIGTGTENGLPYIDLQWSGTITGGITFLDFEGSQQIAAAQGQTWTSSVFAKLVAGSFANVTNIRLVTQSNNSSGTGLSGNLSSGAPSLLGMSTGAMTRYTSIYTLPDATAAFVLPYLRFDTAGAINFTIRLYALQIEQLPFATSPIIAGGTSATRAADNITAAGPFLAAILNAKAARCVTNLGGGLPDAYLFVSNLAPFQGTRIHTTTQIAISNGSNAAFASVGSGGYSELLKMAFGFDNSSLTVVANAGTKATSANAWGALGAPIYIGANAGAAFLNGYFSRLTFCPTKGMFDSVTSGSNPQ